MDVRQSACDRMKGCGKFRGWGVIAQNNMRVQGADVIIDARLETHRYIPPVEGTVKGDAVGNETVPVRRKIF